LPKEERAIHSNERCSARMSDLARFCVIVGIGGILLSMFGLSRKALIGSDFVTVTGPFEPFLIEGLIGIMLLIIGLSLKNPS